MSSHQARTDVAIPGTSRHRRDWGFEKPLTQRECAVKCCPKATQAWVSQFDLAQFRLSREGAARIAPALWPELWRLNTAQARADAIRKVWVLWLTNVEHFGDDAMVRYADALRGTIFSDVQGLSETPIFDPKCNPSINDNRTGGATVIGLGDVCPAPRGFFEQRKAGGA